MNRYLTGITLALAGAFSMMAQAETTKKETLKVELLVFSGRPNPTFAISDEKEIQEILSLAKNLPQRQLKSGESALPTPKLGYQGFIVTNNTTTSPEIKSFVVNGSSVELALNSAGAKTAARGVVVEQSARADTYNALQSKLLSHAKETGIANDEMVQAIENAQ
jgi:hypothetical protein